MADAYNRIDSPNDNFTVNMKIYQSVWKEANKLRETGNLINHTNHIKCPVVAIHGKYDPGPIDGVEQPLTERISNFKLIILEKCGHTPWEERFAHEKFYSILREEINQCLQKPTK